MLHPDPVSARKAALLVHGLPTPARQAVLARLEPAQRSRLEGLLEELRQLAIPAGRHWSDLLAEAQVPSTGNLLEDVAALSADNVIKVLSKQPMEVVAAIWRGGAWPWAEAVLHGLPAHESAKLNRCLRDQQAPTAAAMHVLLQCMLDAAGTSS